MTQSTYSPDPREIHFLLPRFLNRPEATVYKQSKEAVNREILTYSFK
jgi:hypothetical protein